MNPEKDESGQTVVEYILLLFVIVTIVTTVMAQLQNRFLANPGDCQEGDKRFSCRLVNRFSTLGSEQNFKYFTIPR